MRQVSIHRLAFFSLAAVLCASGLEAATYLPGPDADLAIRAPIIVRAQVVSRESRMETIDGVDRLFTIVTLARLETIKGFLSGDTIALRLPGGRVGDVVSFLPGTPSLPDGREVVLFLENAPGHAGEHRLTQFAMSKFDLLADEAGRRFAVRSEFGPEEDVVLAAREPSVAAVRAKGATPSRDADSFLSALRALSAGEPAAEVTWAVPTGNLGHDGGVGLREKWDNIGGREPGDCGGMPCLFRWFWDTGASPNAVLTVTGTQTNLKNDEPTCGTDSNCDVQNASTKWHAVAATDVRISGPATGGTVTVALDATQDFNGGSVWTTPLGCEAGVIGLGGPGNASGPLTFRGDGNYFANAVGNVSMRKVTCAQGYSAATFRAGVLHEVGHVLGLGHPDQGTSIHSTTPSSSWDTAVMHSVIPSAKPDTPQPDDIQAIQYYYGTAAVGPAPVANFTFSPASPATGAAVSFADTSANAPTGWNWDFGDSASSSNTATTKNASHAFGAPGTYTVTLTAGSLNGSGAISKSLTVTGQASVCVPGTNTLCLNHNRFRVTADWQKQDGTSGHGTAVPLTSDTGYFWFFGATNIELITKVLNACANPFNHYWVFAAGLTNVKVTLTVTDTSNGSVKQYPNPLGTAYAPVQDTTAFATCP
jgi:PKD repeat protein